MREAFGDLFDMEGDALCITTNGFVKRNGECVMGRGIAKAIQEFYPNIPKDLGKLIKSKGNHVHLIYEEDETDILSFPVKPISKICTSHNDYVSHMKFNIGDTIAGWACKADIDIIKQSAYELVTLTDKMGYNTVLLPRAGCGAGELSWQDVKPILDNILDNRFISVTFK